MILTTRGDLHVVGVGGSCVRCLVDLLRYSPKSCCCTGTAPRVYSFASYSRGEGSGLLLFEIKEEAAHAVQGVVLMEICCIYKGKHTVEVEGGLLL